MADTAGRTDNSADPLIGRTIGSYVIRERLGRGGMGSVYKAEHQLIGKKVAIKVLLKEFATNELLVQRFFNEARAVNKIGHDNIVDISDYGKTDDGWIYYVMELLEGRELTKLIKELVQVPLPRAIHIIRQCALALDACHKQGIIHRDLKPDNIFLITHGGREDFVKILDFGVAKLANEETGYTRQGAVLGTPHYMSPEQAEGHPVDQRTDIYALGIIMYRMLTGKVPFPGTTFSAVIVKVLTEPPRPPRSLKTDLPVAIDRVILKAISKSPDDRYKTTLEFLDELEKAANIDPLAQEAMASPVKVAAPSTSASQPITAAGEVVNKNKHNSWADGLPRLPDDTLNGARTQSGTPAPQQSSTMPWLIVGIAVGVAVALGVASIALWFFVIKPGQQNPIEINNPIANPINPNNPNTVAVNPNNPPDPKPNPLPNPATSIVSVPSAKPMLQIDSDPPGAAIRKGQDKVALGFTPFSMELPTEAITFTVSAPGFEPTEVSFTPGSKDPLKASLTKKAFEDKTLAEYFRSLSKEKDPAVLSEAISPDGVKFFRSPAGDSKIFNKDKAIDPAPIETRNKGPLVPVTRQQIVADKKIFQAIKSGLAAYYDDYEETSYPWSCNVQDLYCYQRLPSSSGSFYSKAIFAYQNGGLVLTDLLIFTGRE